jgi:hypothetical protein
LWALFFAIFNAGTMTKGENFMKKIMHYALLISMMFMLSPLQASVSWMNKPNESRRDRVTGQFVPPRKTVVVDRYVERLGVQEEQDLAALAVETVYRLNNDFYASAGNQISSSAFKGMMDYFDQDDIKDARFVQLLAELDNLGKTSNSVLFFDGACRGASMVLGGNYDIFSYENTDEEKFIKKSIVNAAAFLAEGAINTYIEEEAFPDLSTDVKIIEYMTDMRGDNHMGALQIVTGRAQHDALRTFFAGAYKGALFALKSKIILNRA